MCVPSADTEQFERVSGRSTMYLEILTKSGNEKCTIGQGTRPFVEILVLKGAEIVHHERPFSPPKGRRFPLMLRLLLLLPTR